MQGQLANIQQFCIAIGQQPPSNIYAPTQHQGMSNNRIGRRNGGGQGGGGSGGSNQQPTWYGFGGAGAPQPLRPPTPYKRWENQNYCHTHGSNINGFHMSATCGKPGPTHNPHAALANTMGGSATGMHKTILPSASDRTAPSRRPQQQQLSQQRPSIAHYPVQGAAWQQAHTCAFWRNVSGRRLLPPANDHGHPGASAQPSHDELCRTVSSRHWNHANYAAAQPTGEPNDDTLLYTQPAALPCSHPTAQPSQPAATGILFLTSRGG